MGSDTLESCWRSGIDLLFNTWLTVKTARTLISMGFFDSEIVQQEAMQLFQDYQNLMQLGSSYGKFDREGKILYIERMEGMMERYRIFMKRFELSEDFTAKMTVEQLKTSSTSLGSPPSKCLTKCTKPSNA
jgi:hypothetical protein